MKKRIMHIILTMALILSVIGGHVNSSAAVKISRKKLTMRVGEKIQLYVYGSKKKVKWSSKNAKICKVSKTGMVTAKKQGKTYIKAKAGKKTLKCNVTVKKKYVSNTNNQYRPVATVAPMITAVPTVKPTVKPTSTAKPTGTPAVEKLTITPSQIVLPVGATYDLTLTYTPEITTGAKVYWSTGDSSIASVDSGRVTAKEPGTTDIKVYWSEDYDVYTICTVVVKELEVNAGTVGSNGGGDILLTESDACANMSYTLSETMNDVIINVLDAEGNIIHTDNIGTINAGEEKIYTWNLATDKGTTVEAGTYTFELNIKGAKFRQESFYIYQKSDFASGNGSENNPYLISDENQLKQIVKHNNRYFKQTKDIDMNYGEITTLFTKDVPFEGVYDGNGCKIMNFINTSDTSCYGLFRAVGERGSIKNLVLDECNIKGKEYVGILVGYNKGSIVNCTFNKCTITASTVSSGTVCGYSIGSILNCKTLNCAVVSQGEGYFDNLTADNRYFSLAGSICGVNEGVIRKCNSENDNISAKQTVGGMTGYNEGVITECVVKNDSITGEMRVGGIAGYNHGSVLNCEVDDENGKITATESTAGGIVGYDRDSVINNNTYYGSLSQIAE